MAKKAPEWLNADIQEFYNPHDVNIRAIQGAIREKRGVEIAYMTITDRMKRLGLERPKDKLKQAKSPPAPQESPMPDDVVEVLPGQMSMEDTDTAPAEVHYGAVHEFDALPEGYAKVIQPMQPYSEAEEWALHKSMELYGFIGAIVRDQYGRILDGHHRQRVARQRGLGVPHTITQVKDDAHAIDIARALNTVRRHYTREQREELAPMMREQGFTYEAIAEALGVGKATVYRDVMGVLRVRAEQIVPNETIPTAHHAAIVPNETIEHQNHDENVPNETISAQSRELSPPVARVKRKGGGAHTQLSDRLAQSPRHRRPIDNWLK